MVAFLLKDDSFLSQALKVDKMQVDRWAHVVVVPQVFYFAVQEKQVFREAPVRVFNNILMKLSH